MKKKLLVLLGMFIFCQFGFSLSCLYSYYYIKDKKVIYNGYTKSNTVRNADVETFRKLDGFFGIDKRNVYYYGKVLKKIDAKTFEVVSMKEPERACQVVSIGIFQDKNGVYSIEDILSGKIK